MRNQKGFTLIELMIVVAIIGILAAIAIPQYQNYVARSEVSEAMTLASGLKTDVAEAYNTTGSLTGVSSTSGRIPAADTVTGKYVSGVSVTDGVITATMRSGSPVAGSIQGDTLKLEPGYYNNGTFTSLPSGSDSGAVSSVSWKCSGGDTNPIPTKYLPSACTSS